MQPRSLSTSHHHAAARNKHDPKAPVANRHVAVEQRVGTDKAGWCAPPSRGSRWSPALPLNPVLARPDAQSMKQQTTEPRMWNRLMAAGRTGVASELEAAHRYTKAFPEFPQGWILLAKCLASVSRFGEAQAALRKASSLVAPVDRVHIASAWGAFYREKGNEKSSERWYRRAVALRPNPALHIFLGAALARQGKFAEAKHHQAQAIALARKVGKGADEAHYNLALILRAEGQYRAAGRHLRKAIQVDPKYTIAKEALRDVESAMHIRKAG